MPQIFGIYVSELKIYKSFDLPIKKFFTTFAMRKTPMKAYTYFY